jgi:hypothetical protein
MVQRWGAYLGAPEELGEPDDRNPHGRFEYAPLWDLLARIGDFASGRSWWDASFPDYVRAMADDADAASSARDLVNHMRAPGGPWAWKDPALAHFLGFWSRFWRDPIFVVTVRNPLDIAKSWQKFIAAEGHEPNSLECNLARWQHMSLCVLRGTEGARKLFVEYERLIAAPADQARRLAAFLDPECGCSSTDETVDAMAAASERALWRNRGGITEADDALTEPQRALYRLQQARVLNSDTPFIDSFPMAAGWRGQVIAAERRS